MPARPTVQDASFVSDVTTSDSCNSGKMTSVLELTISIVVPLGASKVWALRLVELKRRVTSLPEPPLRKHKRTP